MFRRILLSSVAATAMVGSAYAADLPSRKAPLVAPPVPVFTWTGFYIGANAGAVFNANNSNGFNNATFFGGAAPIGGFGFGNNGNNRSVGAIVGGQVGVNWQVSQFVIGLEGDAQALRDVNNNNNFLGNFGNDNRTGFLGTVRGRVGVAFDHVLVYATGGAAFSSNSGFNNNAFGTVGGAGAFFFTNNNGGSSRVGYAVGGGVEYAFTNNWSIKGEYLYVDRGRRNQTFLIPGGAAGFILNNRQQVHIARVGLNYKFDWGMGAAPVVARY